MMKAKRNIYMILICMSILFVIFIVLLLEKVNAEKINHGKKIIVELTEIRPEKSKILTKDILKKLIPELKQPRIMSLTDLDDYEKDMFVKMGFGFVLQDDFNRDKIADMVFVGKYDNPKSPQANSFIAIVNIEGNRIVRTLFLKIHREKISLKKVKEYKHRIDAIGMSFDILTDDCGYLYWDGKEWRFDECKF